MTEDHGALEAGKLPTAWTRGCREAVAKEQATQGVRSWTVQNEMSGVLERMAAGAASTILASVNPREVRA